VTPPRGRAAHRCGPWNPKFVVSLADALLCHGGWQRLRGTGPLAALAAGELTFLAAHVVVVQRLSWSSPLPGPTKAKQNNMLGGV